MVSTRHTLSVALVAIGLARDPGCGSVDESQGAVNAPCTRTKDCVTGLVCAAGVCVDRDAGSARDAAPDGSALFLADAGPDAH